MLHEPALKALYPNLGGEGGWERLHCMQGWESPKDPAKHPNSNYSSTWLEYVGLCDLIASASDRTTVGRLPAEHSAILYGSEGLQLHHLLSGKKQTLILNEWHHHITGADSRARTEFLDGVEEAALNEILECDDPQEVFWWLWRCYTQALSTSLGDEPCIHLLPAETRLPDASLWSHATMTSALAGALAGYYDQLEDYPKKNARFLRSRPYVATFSFTPVQELIKASRKMRDFWAGSWLLHYLSAKVCWAIAQKYGPDTLLYPCLYSQPLIDHWLLKKYDFNEWIKQPSDQQLLTAGFPNVLVMILPNNGKNPDDMSGNPVRSAMAYAEAVLKQEWNNLGKEVLAFLQSGNREGSQEWRDINPQTWEGWLKTQWQTYWVALPIGESTAELHHSPRQDKEFKEWIGKQNDFANPYPALFVKSEYRFLEAVFKQTAPQGEDKPSETREEFKARQPNINVGSWWASIFDQVRFNLNSVKNARTWQLPTAFGPRSTVSGLGSVVHPIYDPAKPEWATEGETEQFWSNDMGLFDGIEELNATEVLKRGLHQVLLPVLFPDREDNQPGKVPVLYPDLSSGVAGWLRQMEEQENQEAISYFQGACQEIIKNFPWAKDGKDAPAHLPWGIPWIAKNHDDWLNPRLLNAGWLIDDFHAKNLNPAQPLTLNEQKKAKQDELRRLREQISQGFKPGNNPTDWYVLAAGDGDGMSEWLKGEKLKPYSNYMPDALHEKIKQMPEHLREPFQAFLTVTKRMGPATHSALSRALLDFSNQLVPYLTEERYAGRLIYAGGDDVLAYTNLWEWDKWLWDIRQCFRGDEDEKNEFDDQGDYWRWKGEKNIPEMISPRPLFTMGNTATISFGVVIANHSVPLAIALENLWEAEDEAKEHFYISSEGKTEKKDAVQVRVLYGTGNVLKSTAKFHVFQLWKQLLEAIPDLDAALFEQAATVWSQHPAPVLDAIAPWTQAFCNRRDVFKGDDIRKAKFREALENFLCELWKTTPEKDGEREIQNWLKLAALIIRKREIKLGGES
nr:type III-B CRISPR-associated protein Cas10/Cmr2 [Microcoleus sp. FACHB-68]